MSLLWTIDEFTAAIDGRPVGEMPEGVDEARVEQFGHLAPFLVREPGTPPVVLRAG